MSTTDDRARYPRHPDARMSRGRITRHIAVGVDGFTADMDGGVEWFEAFDDSGGDRRDPRLLEAIRHGGGTVELRYDVRSRDGYGSAAGTTSRCRRTTGSTSPLSTRSSRYAARSVSRSRSSFSSRSRSGSSTKT